MVSEEFYFRIKRMEENEKRWEALYQSFSKKLLRELPDIVCDFVPRVAERRNELEDKLLEIIHKYIRKVWDCFDSAYHYNFHQKKVGNITSIPSPESREESEKKLQDKLLNIPQEAHADYSEFHWELFDKTKRHYDYLYAVYKKFKEAMAKNYGEYIQDFNGDCIRMLNSDIYHSCACWFVDDVYGLTPRPSMFLKTGKPKNEDE